MADTPSNPPRTRVRRHLEEAERDAGIAGVPSGAASVPGSGSSVPPDNAGPDKRTGISFFNGGRGTSAANAAKKNALINKLRGPASPPKNSFKGSGFGAKVDASDADADDEDD